MVAGGDLMKVLVVDDDPDQLALRCMLLGRIGVETLGASDRTSAAQIAATEKPKCAVVDLRLPTSEAGLGLVRSLKALDPAIHIIVLTGGDSERLSREPEAALVDEVMTKGTSVSALLDRVKALSGHSAL